MPSDTKLSASAGEHYAADAPVMLPGWMHDRIELEGVGLPPEHPWHDGIPKFE